MKVRPCSTTMAALRGMAVLPAFLLFPAHPAWSRSNVDPNALGQALHEAHALFVGDTQEANADYIGQWRGQPGQRGNGLGGSFSA